MLATILNGHTLFCFLSSDFAVLFSLAPCAACAVGFHASSSVSPSSPSMICNRVRIKWPGLLESCQKPILDQVRVQKPLSSKLYGLWQLFSSEAFSISCRVYGSPLEWWACQKVSLLGRRIILNRSKGSFLIKAQGYCSCFLLLKVNYTVILFFPLYGGKIRLKE